MSGRTTSGVVLAMVLTFAGACEDSPTVPEITGGAGLRFFLPAGVDTLAAVRFELWHDNDVLPPFCSEVEARAAKMLLASPVDSVDFCTRMEVHIKNLVGETVRFVADTSTTGSLSWPWDAQDDRGEPVSSGYYSVTSRCLDSRGEFTFRGHYFYWAEREIGACEWPLWILETSPGPEAEDLRFGPFPEAAQTYLLDSSGIPRTLVSFTNPFLVRVHASGHVTFEQTVTLTEGKFTEVHVTFVPAAS